MAQLDRLDTEPVLFVAEALLPYFEGVRVKDLVLTLLEQFPGAESACDVCTPLAVRIDNLHLRFTRAAARMHWAVKDPRDLETWGRDIRLVESFCYFDDPEPRMGLPSWFGRFPVLARSTSIQRYQLGTATAPASKNSSENGSSAADWGMTA